MKRITWTALVLFVVSFFLPAYFGGEVPGTGWWCLRYCLGTPWDESMAAGWKLYYFGFGITNAAFVVLAALHLRGRDLSGVAGWLSVAPLAHVASWWVINVSGEDTFFKNAICYGYFVWLAAFALLSMALLRASKTVRGREARQALADKPWFPAKTAGYGWGMPTGWQGRVVVGVYGALLIAGALVILREPRQAGYYFAYMLGLSLILILICWWKGEDPNGPGQ